ncbi:DMT family transporter [Mesobacterium pallidum]|uniref:DMT family transporter n=1 Tax=Mesobacterium pallidum TaxID=2872037 RepID=UPI001EE1B5EF|nr:DMT family transporter [Mesobacterium pallidum]
MQDPEITWKSWAMVGLLGLVWGGTFMFQEIALRSTPPFWVATARIGFAAVLTWAVWRARGGRMFTSSDSAWGLLFVTSLLSAAMPFMLLAWGQQFVTSGFTGVSMATVALIVLPIAHFVIPGERLSWRKTAGFCVGFAGVLVLIGPGALRPSGDAMELWGRLACIGAAGCYAVSSIIMRRLPPLDPFGLSFATLAFGTLFVAPLALATHGLPASPGAKGFAVLALIGLVPTAGANLLRILVIRSAGPVFMSLTNYQVPLWSVALGILFLGEDFRWSLIAALGLILVGLALSQWGAFQRLFRRA